MKYKFSEKLIILSCIIFLFICLGFLSFTSHAATYEDYYPLHQNADGFLTSEQLEYFDSLFDARNNLIFGYLYSSNNGYNIMVFTYCNNSNNAMMFGEIGNDPRYFNIYRGNGINYHIEKSYEWHTGDFYNGSSWNINFNQFFSNIDSTKGTFISNFDIYSNNNPETQKLILNYSISDDPVVGTGHATPPDPFEDPTLSTGSDHTLPREVPESPTINNYTWITYNPPSIDTTNLESLLESLIYVINYLAGWLRDNLSGEFQNLISNITGLINYIGETIQYYGGLIISNIQNGIETFYNNMVSLFEPISAKIDYLTEPVDGTIIYDNISSTSLVTNINTINSSLTDFQNSFNSLSEPSSFTIPIHLENLPSAYFGNQTTQYIDLGVIGSTEKTLIRTFMWAIITYGLFITIVDSVSNYINGGGDES